MPVDDFPRYHSSASGVDDTYATRPLRLPEGSAGGSGAAQQPTPPRKRRSPLILLLDGLFILLLLGVFAAGGTLYYLDKSYQGKIYPNVTIQGVQVGQMSQDQAEAAIRARYDAFLKQPATLTYQGQTWNPTPADLGISFDFGDSAAAAYEAGRGNGMVQNLSQINSIWNNGLELSLRAQIDQQKINAYVQQISNAFNVAPVDATLQLDGTRVTTTPAHPGRQVLVDQTVQQLTDALQTFAPQTVELRTRDVQPRLHDDQVAAAKQRIESLVQGPFTMHVKGKEYGWTAEDLARMLTIGRVAKDGATDQMSVEVNPFFVERQIRKIVDETGRGSVNPRVSWNGGNLKIIRPGVSGWRVDEKQAQQAVMAALATPQRELDLPTADVAPSVTEANVQSLGINELISSGRSDFSGSAEYRIHNIGVGMATLNGILVGPGEEFSFNDNIGSIDDANGYVQGYAIIQNRTQLEFGGGICQDSTTMFRAAFWGGFPITERWGHSFYISWYDKYAYAGAGNGPGMDATIFTGGPDLKFLNDTGHWILVQSYSDPSSAVAEVAIYGTKSTRTVAVDRRVYDQKAAPTEPKIIYDKTAPTGSRKQTDTARGGMTIDVLRTITENGVAKKPQLFRTTFKPWPNIFVVGPQAPKPAPQPTAAPVPAAVAAPAEAAPAPAAAPAQPEATPTN